MAAGADLGGESGAGSAALPLSGASGASERKKLVGPITNAHSGFSRLPVSFTSKTFEIGERELEMGVGIHGEPGRRRVAMMSADAIAAETVGAVCEDLQPGAGQEVLLFVNGMGGTPLLELYGMYDAARRECEARGLTIARSLVGNYCTSLEMAGCSITLVKLDAELKALWDAPVHTAALRWGL